LCCAQRAALQLGTVELSVLEVQRDEDPDAIGEFVRSGDAGKRVKRS
jgi:hypothetical protein